MEKLLVIAILFLNMAVFSQTDFLTFKSKYDEFDYYAKPSPNNELSKYFKRSINTSLLDAINFEGADEAKKRIFLFFRLNDNNQFTYLSANSAYSELNKSITDAFREYDLKKLEIPNKSRLNTFVLQIVSTENGKPIVNCNTALVYDTLPIFDTCEISNDHMTLKKCLDFYLENYVVNTISPLEFQKEKLMGDIALGVNFLVDSDGHIKNINCKAPTPNLTELLHNAIAAMPKVKEVATRNGNPSFLEIQEIIKLYIKPATEQYKEEVLKDNETMLDDNSDLANHFESHFKNIELQSIRFAEKQKEVWIQFSIDKKGNYVNVKNNLKDPFFSEKLNMALRIYPMEKHGIEEIDVMANYSYTIITKVMDKLLFQTQKKPIVLLSPVFKGCERERTAADVSKCTAQLVRDLLLEKFDTDVRHETDLEGEIRMQCAFRVDTNGSIIDVKVKAPNPYLANEFESVIKSIPRAVKPGFKNGKPIKSPFYLPLVFQK